MNRTKLFRFIFFMTMTIFLLSFSIENNQNPKQRNGKVLFDKYCAACHHPTKTLTASPFPFIRQKNGKEWVYKIVKNNFKFQAQDKKARQSFKGKNLMTTFEGILTNKDIDLICDYVDEINKTK